MGCTAFYAISVLDGFVEALCLVGENEKVRSFLWKLDFHLWKDKRSVVIGVSSLFAV